MGTNRTGAIILAAGKSKYMDELKPMLKLGQTTMIQREIDTLRTAGLSPIVVVTGYQAEELEKHIAHRGAVCIRNRRYETSQMYASICMGLRYIQKKADRVLLFPSDVPLVSAETIEKMAKAPGSAAVPVHDGRRGHPVMLSREIFQHVLSYRGGQGLRGAMDDWEDGVTLVELEDPGILLDTNTKQDYESLLQYEKDSREQTELGFRCEVTLFRPQDCFDGRTAAFLEAVDEAGSMLAACQKRDISYSKGWKMVKTAEDQLGIVFLSRQPGGSRGGFSALTAEGRAFLERYRRLEKRMNEAAQAAFEEIFSEKEENR